MSGSSPRLHTNDTTAQAAGFVRTCLRSKAWRVVVLLLLVVHGWLVLSTARYCTVTHDEYWHIPVGLLNLRNQKFDYERLNPPGGRMLAALPLLFTAAPQQIDDPTVENDIWRYGDEFLQQNKQNYHSLIIAARMPGVVFSLIFALVAAAWANELFGFSGGVATLVLWTFSPSIISSAALATNDLLVTGMFLVTLRFCSRGKALTTLRAQALIGLSLGLSCLVKFTGLILFALVPLAIILSLRRESAAGFKSVSVAVRATVIAWAIALAIVNAGYLFEGSGTAIGEFKLQSEACRTIQGIVESIAVSLPVPLPSAFLEGVDHQRFMMESNHPIYLDGEWSQTGFRSYYFWVLLWKLPHAVQLLIASALWGGVRLRRTGVRRRRSVTSEPSRLISLSLLCPVVTLLTIGSLSSMQLGLRYILPCLPMLFIAGSATFAQYSSRSRLKQVFLVLVLCTTVASVRHHPHHIAYFNELAGGPENGWKLLSDSNIDWGQDLNSLATYVQNSGEVRDLKLAYFGTFPPGQLGIEYTIPPEKPVPGWYAISINLLQGRPNPLRRQDGTVENIFQDRFAYLRFFEPKARIGASIRVYRITEEGLKQRRIEMQQARHRF